MSPARRLLCLAGLATPLWLAGCAAPRSAAPPAAERTRWNGRLALQLDETPPRAFSAVFELTGTPASGELTLSTPLGTQLAQFTWAASGATMKTSAETRSADSLNRLLQDLTGAPLPVAALFDWLAGHASSAEGWHADLGQLPDGRLSARRSAPAPAATLRIFLDH